MASFLRACPELSFAANEQGAFSSSANNFLACRTTNTVGHKSRDTVCVCVGMDVVGCVVDVCVNDIVLRVEY
jgi:hypothetical protein